MKCMGCGERVAEGDIELEIHQTEMWVAIECARCDRRYEAVLEEEDFVEEV